MSRRSRPHRARAWQGKGSYRAERRERLARKGVAVHNYTPGIALSQWAEPVGCPAPGHKITYATRDNAQAASDAIQAAGGDWTRPYACDVPGYGLHWHLTSSPARTHANYTDDGELIP